MTNFLKRSVSLLLVISMLIGIMPMTVLADDERIVVSEINATTNVNPEDIAVHGAACTVPEFTVADACKPAYFWPNSTKWQKNINDTWTDMSSSDVFNAGTWRLKAVAFIDSDSLTHALIGGETTGDGTTHRISEDVVVNINDSEWSHDPVSTSASSSSVTIYSEEIVIPASEELFFADYKKFDIPASNTNIAITSFSVAEAVEGGTGSYTFSKIDGPDWITVSEDGTISGTPTLVQENENLVVGVQDEAEPPASAQITIAVAKTNLNPAEREVVSSVVATTNVSLATIAVLDGDVTTPTFTVTTGKPAYFWPTSTKWEKKGDGDSWSNYEEETFVEGTYRLKGGIFIDNDSLTLALEAGEPTGDGTTHVLDNENLEVTVNGEEWSCGSVGIGNARSNVTVYSGEFEVSASSSAAVAGSITIPTLDNLEVGYGEQSYSAVTINLTNTGDVDSSKMQATLSGENAESFQIMTSFGGVMSAPNTWNNVLYIRPIEGLAVGTYTATLTLKFNADGDDVYETTIGSDGVSVTVTKKQVTNVAVTIDKEPTVGEYYEYADFSHISTPASVTQWGGAGTGGCRYNVKVGEDWVVLEYGEGNEFEEGKEYQAFVKVSVLDSDAYEFADDVTATINGHEASVYNGESYIEISYSFGVLGDVSPATVHCSDWWGFSSNLAASSVTVNGSALTTSSSDPGVDLEPGSEATLVVTNADGWNNYNFCLRYDKGTGADNYDQTDLVDDGEGHMTATFTVPAYDFAIGIGNEEVSASSTSFSANKTSVDFGSFQVGFTGDESNEHLQVVRFTNTGTTTIKINHENPSSSGPFGSFGYSCGDGIAPGEYIDVTLRTAESSWASIIPDEYEGVYVFTATNVEDEEDTAVINITGNVIITKRNITSIGLTGSYTAPVIGESIPVLSNAIATVNGEEGLADLLTLDIKWLVRTGEGDWDFEDAEGVFEADKEYRLRMFFTVASAQQSKNEFPAANVTVTLDGTTLVNWQKNATTLGMWTEDVTPTAAPVTSKTQLTKPTLETDEFEYDGSEISVSFVDLDEDNCVVSGTTEATGVGEYTITISIDDKDNYEWSDETNEDVVLNWSIVLPEFAGSITVPTFDDAEVGYASISNKAVTITISNSYIIDPARLEYEITGTNASDFSVTLNKSAGTLNGDGSWTNIFSVKPNSNLSIGTYTATLTLKYDEDGDDKYETTIGSGTLTFVVTEATPTTYNITIVPNGGSGSTSYLNDIPAGAYSLSEPSVYEIGTPDGKVFAGWLIGSTVYDAGEEFTVNDNLTATAQWNTLIDTITITGVELPVAGETPATSAVLDTEGLTQSAIYWTTTDGNAIEGPFVAGTQYRLYVEYSIDDGYELAKAPTVSANIDPDESIIHESWAGFVYTVPEPTYSIEISAVYNSDALEGATIQFFKEGITDPLVTFVSTTDSYEIDNLSAGSYTIKVTDAPDGYIIPDDIDVTISDVGEISSTGTVTDTTCLVEFEMTLVNVLGVKVSDGSELAGITIQVTDKDGNLVEEWSSTTDVHSIQGLHTEEEYTIKVTVVPGDNEYEIPADTTFTIGTDGKVTSTGSMTLEGVLLVEIAEKEVTKYEVTFNSNGGSEVAKQDVVEGQTATKPTDPTNGELHFIGWFVNPTVDNFINTETMAYNTFDFSTPITENIELTALWVATLQINTTGSGSGQVSLVGPTVNFEFDDEYPATSIYHPARIGLDNTVTIGAKEADGSEFVKWTKNGEDYSTEKTIEVTITEDTEFVAEFAVIQYTVSFDSNGGSGEMDEELVNANSQYTLPACGFTAPDGKVFDKWDLGKKGAKITVTGDVTLVAQWKDKPISVGGGGGSATTTYKITTKAENGTITPNNPEVEKGKDQKFTFKANDGYEIEDVLVDGESVGKVTNYTLENVKAKHTIEVKFAKVEQGQSGSGDSHDTLENPFEDVKETDWFYDSVMSVVKDGLFNGVSSTRFAPNMNLTRGMLVTVLYRYAGAKETEKSTFDDVAPNAYYSEAVAWAAKNGIVYGVGDNKFNPDANITRQDLSAIMYRYLKLQGKGFVGMWAFLLEYADREDIADYAYEPVCYLTMNGIVTGKNGNRFDPKGLATRAEAATIMERLSTFMSANVNEVVEDKA